MINNKKINTIKLFVLIKKFLFFILLNLLNTANRIKELYNIQVINAS